MTPRFLEGHLLRDICGETSRQNQRYSFTKKELIFATVETVGPHGPKSDALSPELEQASDVTLRWGTRPGSPHSIGLSDSDSSVIDLATLE
jgi:hypothetical protein